MIGLEISQLKSEIEETLKDCDTECEQYCKKYITKYLSIKYSNPKWLTLSPKSLPDTHPKDILKYHLSMYLKDLSLCSKNILGVVEFANERMHFHICIDVKDSIKYNVIVNTMMAYSMCRSYKGMPKNGIHYLFKNITEALQILSIEDVIITEDKLQNIIQEEKLQRKIQRQETKKIRAQMKLEEVKKSYLSIPKWMLDDTNSEEE